jgi:tRNA(Ile)-lysidine synthetase-like protein
MELLAAEDDYLDRVARGWTAAPGDPPFPQLPVAIQRRALLLGLVAKGLDADFDLVEHLRQQPEIPITISPGRAVRRDKDGQIRVVGGPELAFGQAQALLNLVGPGQIDWEGVRVSWRVQTNAPHSLRPRPGREWYDAERVGSAVRLRHWQPGDRFEPSGLGAAAKLQDLFTNRKMPAAQRRALLLAVTAAGEIWWVEGLRIAERFKVRPGTSRFLEWRWLRRPNPGVETRPISADRMG